MGYDGDFYEAYERYLHEPRVRIQHDRMFEMWATVQGSLTNRVIDLGCGRSNEYLRFGPSVECYQGFDVHEGPQSMVADYRDRGFVDLVHGLDWTPDVFVSMFSTECTAPWRENVELYERLFREFPTIQAGLVTGFYYARRRGENPVEETGGIVSWQTLEPIERMRSDVYRGIRVVAEVPSEMFGDDVVEVWRMLTRR